MGITYYAFALFIAALVCLIGILFKLLFGNVKKQRRLLEEKESSLLQLYQTVESIMEDFNEQIAAAMDDIREYESRAAEAFAAAQSHMQEALVEEPTIAPSFMPMTAPGSASGPGSAPPIPMTIDSTRIRAASEVLERAERMVKGNVGRSADYIVGSEGGSGEVVQRLLDDDSIMDGEAYSLDIQGKTSNRDLILAMSEEGKTQSQIARELGITQNEVKLVIDLVAHLANN